MYRRAFLKLAAAGAALGLGPRPAPGAAAAENTTSMHIPEEPVAHRNQNRSTVACCNGIACTSQPLASMAAVDMLKAGGNAVDAAMAANAMLSLVEPMSCGPGGDLFAIVWCEKDRKLHGLNASGRSPYAWDLAGARGLGLTAIPPYSPLAWSVPGCVSGWKALHERFGRLSLGQILAPVIHYAREGFPVSPVIAFGWRIDARQHPTLAETFTPDGRPRNFGDIARNPQLAAFYEILLRDGLDAFYHGEVADRIVAFSEQAGGRFAKRDFEEHTAEWADPVSANYRGYDIWELPPNGQGIAVLQIMNMLETFDIASLPPNSPEQLHLFLEAKKLAYEDRGVYYADPAMADVPVSWLISKEYARQRANLIDPRHAAQDIAAGTLEKGGDTVYLATADRDGNMVSLIQSIYHGWGSHFVPDRLGFALQNRGELFALDPAHRNRLEPHKRPFHTIIPAFVTQDGAPVFAFGVMGGDFQPQGHAQVLMNWADYRMSPQRAGEQPRVEHDGSSSPTGEAMKRGGGIVGLEDGIPDATRAGLAAFGHRIKKGTGAFGGYQGIQRADGPLRYFGGSDPRKDGAAIGF